MHNDELHNVRPLVVTEIACFGGASDSYDLFIDLCMGCIATLLVAHAVLHCVGRFD